MWKLRFPGAVAAAATALVLSGSGAYAQSLTQTLLSNILGHGDTGPAINYSERAPLVMPPKRDMRPPVDAQAAVASDPAWPKDPDEKKRRKSENSDIRGPANSNAELMTRDEMATGTLKGPGVDNGKTSQEDLQDYHRSSNPVNPKVLAHKGTFGATTEPLVAGVEPPRRSLVEPPKGLRTPLATAPLDGEEQLPSERDADLNKPWYQRVWAFGGK